MMSFTCQLCGQRFLRNEIVVFEKRFRSSAWRFPREYIGWKLKAPFNKQVDCTSAAATSILIQLNVLSSLPRTILPPKSKLQMIQALTFVIFVSIRLQMALNATFCPRHFNFMMQVPQYSLARRQVHHQLGTLLRLSNSFLLSLLQLDNLFVHCKYQESGLSGSGCLLYVVVGLCMLSPGLREHSLMLYLFSVFMYCYFSLYMHLHLSPKIVEGFDAYISQYGIIYPVLYFSRTAVVERRTVEFLQ